MNNLVTIPICSIQINGNIIRIQLKFKIENKNFYWNFNVNRSDIRYADNKNIVLPLSYIDKFKEKLKHHSFNLVRYKASYVPNDIKIEYHNILEEPIMLASTSIKVYNDDHLGLSPCYEKTIRSGQTFVKLKGKLYIGNYVEIIKSNRV